MKKVLALCAMAVAMLSANAQDRVFKPFKVNIATGYAIPSGEGTKGGLIFSIEPKYAVMEQLSVGLRLQTAVMVNVSADNEAADATANASYVLTGDYYLNNSQFRPFVGAGAGLFRVASASVTTSSDDVAVSLASKFGGLIRGGFEFGHFRTELEYNLVGATQPTDMATGEKGPKVKSSYLGIKIGVNIGGGRYDN